MTDDRGVMQEDGPAGPEQMRAAVRDYVWALHTTYLDHVRHLPPGERAALPLVAAGDLTVVAAAARQLHLVATTAPLPAPTGPEVEEVDEHLGTRWRLRFFDPSVLPGLGILADDRAEEVRRVLGVDDVVYHLTISPGGGLTAHHAQHSAVALANQQAQVSRDVERLRAALPRDAAAVAELATCVRLGLDRAAALLTGDLTGGRVTPAAGTTAQECLAAVLADATGR